MEQPQTVCTEAPRPDVHSLYLNRQPSACSCQPLVQASIEVEPVAPSTVLPDWHAVQTSLPNTLPPFQLPAGQGSQSGPPCPATHTAVQKDAAGVLSHHTSKGTMQTCRHSTQRSTPVRLAVNNIYLCCCLFQCCGQHALLSCCLAQPCAMRNQVSFTRNTVLQAALTCAGCSNIFLHGGCNWSGGVSRARGTGSQCFGVDGSRTEVSSGARIAVGALRTGWADCREKTKCNNNTTAAHSAPIHSQVQQHVLLAWKVHAVPTVPAGAQTDVGPRAGVQIATHHRQLQQ